MRNRAYNYSDSIRHNVLPTEVVAVGAIVMHLLGYCHHRRHDGADARKDKANTSVCALSLLVQESLQLLIACSNLPS
jgi:hypothetical protein